MDEVLSMTWPWLRRLYGGESKGRIQGSRCKDDTDSDKLDHLIIPLTRNDQSRSLDGHYIYIYDPETCFDSFSFEVDQQDHDDDDDSLDDKVLQVVAEEIPSKRANDSKTVKFSSNFNVFDVSSSSKLSLKSSIGPYNSKQKILLVGEGDFSFSACLAMAFGSASNMVATSLNSSDFLLKNYGNFLTNRSELETRGSVVLHHVDATNMAKHSQLSMMKFDRVIFNFPHSGFKQDSSESQIRRHQELVRGFLKNAKKMIEDDGQIHVTHKTNSFFFKWNLPKLGSDEGLFLIQEVKFELSKYPGYHTKYGFGGDRDFDCNPSKTYKFGLTTKWHNLSNLEFLTF